MFGQFTRQLQVPISNSLSCCHGNLLLYCHKPFCSHFHSAKVFFIFVAGWSADMFSLGICQHLVCHHLTSGLPSCCIWSAIMLHLVCRMFVVASTTWSCHEPVCSLVTPSILGLRDFCAIIGLGGTVMKEGVHLSKPIYTEL